MNDTMATREPRNELAKLVRMFYPLLGSQVLFQSFERLEGVVKRLLSVLVVVLLAWGGVSAQTVNVLCVTADWCELIESRFEAETGIEVRWLALSTNESLVRLRAEAENPTFDVWIGGTGDPHLVAFNEGVTEFHRPAAWDDLLPELRDAVGETYIPLYVNPIAFLINEQVLEDAGVPIPRTWKELADPMYRGLVATPDPNTSGTAYTVIATLVQIFGEDEAFELMAQMHPNIAQYTRSGNGPANMVRQGEIGIGINFMAEGVRSAKAGFPVTVLAPEDGTGIEIGGLSLVAGGPNREAALQFIEWAVTPAGQMTAAEADTLFVMSNRNTPTVPESPDLDALNIIDYDFLAFGDPAMHSRLIARWTNEIFPLPR